MRPGDITGLKSPLLATGLGLNDRRPFESNARYRHINCCRLLMLITSCVLIHACMPCLTKNNHKILYANNTLFVQSSPSLIKLQMENLAYLARWPGITADLFSGNIEHARAVYVCWQPIRLALVV